MSSILGVESGITIKVDMLEELAEKTGMDPETLTATGERYNRCADEDYDKDASCLSAFGDGFYLRRRWSTRCYAW